MATRRGATKTCRFCGGPVRLVPLDVFRVAWVHTESRRAGQQCRRSREVFGERLMDRHQPMLPGMELEEQP